MLYKKILLPHAGTPAGDKALEHAIHLAKSSKAQIIILHVVENIPYAPYGLTLFHSSQIESIKKQLRETRRESKVIMEKEMLKRLQICKKNKIKSELKVKVGIPTDEIIKIVRNQRIDLIVMAKSRKLPGVKRFLALGSVSRKIVEHVSCPVLMVDIEKK